MALKETRGEQQSGEQSAHAVAKITVKILFFTFYGLDLLEHLKAPFASRCVATLNPFQRDRRQAISVFSVNELQLSSGLNGL